MKAIAASVVIAVLLFAVPAHAQDGSSSETFEMDASAPPPPPSEVADAEPSPLTRDWREVTSRFGDFTVRMPGQPDERRKRNENGIEQNDFIVKKNGATYLFVVYQPPNGQLADGEQVEAFAITMLVTLTVVAGVTGKDLKPQLDRTFLYEGVRAGEGRMVTSDGQTQARIRVFIASGYYGALMVARDAGLDEGGPTNDFLRSLKFPPQNRAQ